MKKKQLMKQTLVMCLTCSMLLGNSVYATESSNSVGNDVNESLESDTDTILGTEDSQEVAQSLKSNNEVAQGNDVSSNELDENVEESAINNEEESEETQTTEATEMAEDVLGTFRDSMDSMLQNEDPNLTMPDDDILLANDNTLYLVNCGTENTTNVPNGYTMGYYQSNLDQAYSKDSQADVYWGYVEVEPYLIYSTSSGSDQTLSDSKRYNYDNAEGNLTYTYDSENSGVLYEFQVPDYDHYEVQVGFYNTWDARSVQIQAEDKSVDSFTLTKNSLVEKDITDVSVNDGQLEVFVHNPDRESQYQDALVSYIIIKVPTTYNQAYLKAALEKYKLTSEERAQYNTTSLKKYDEAYKYAKKVSEETGVLSEERVQSYYDKLVKKYEGLQEKGTAETYTSFTGTDAATWLDTDGTKIEAHGGQVQQFTTKDENGNEVTKWYWYGEDKTDGYRTVDGGVKVYSSTDLYNWTDEGDCLRDLTDQYDFEEDYFNDLYGKYTDSQKDEVLAGINDSTSVIERPKVIYNKKNDNYVMWFHADGPTDTSTSNYAAASAGVAVSDSPVGPFKYIGRYRLNYVNGAYSGDQGMARDMNLFVDDDQSAYIVYTSEQNATLFISKLNDDYTGLAEDADVAATKYDAGEDVSFSRIPIYVSASREAPALFKYDDTYYIMSSTTSGWAANEAKYAMCTADTPLGSEDDPWTDCGDPCIADTDITPYGTSLTLGTQSTCIFQYEDGKYIYMGDRWNTTSPSTNSLVDPGYVWLPVEFDGYGKMTIRPYRNWTLDVFDSLVSAKMNTSLPDYIEKDDLLLSTLPDKVSLTVNDETKDYNISWDITKGDITVAGSYITVTGTVSSLGNKTFMKQLFVYSSQMKYMIDCGLINAGKTTEDSAVYSQLESLLEDNDESLLNQTADQEYSESDGWGYILNSYEGVKGYDASLGLNATGYYGANDGSLNPAYQMKLDQGTYQITTGHYEWWNTSAREFTIEAEYIDEDGESVTKTLGTVSFDGTQGSSAYISGEITIPNDNTLLTLTAKRESGNASVISSIAVTEENTDYTGEFAYDESQIPTYVTGVEDMPATLLVSFDDNTTSTDVVWRKSQGDDTVGSYDTFTGITEKGSKVITAKPMIYAKGEQYFIDCGIQKQEDAGKDISSDTVYQDISQLDGVTMLNKEPDQNYEDGSDWGLVSTTNSSKGFDTSAVTVNPLFGTGYYAANDGSTNITYQIKLDKGEYSITTGHYEWWNNQRHFKMTVSYQNADGDTVVQDMGSASLSSHAEQTNINNSFLIDQNDTDVTVTIERIDGDAAILSYLAIYPKVSDEEELIAKEGQIVLNGSSINTNPADTFKGFGAVTANNTSRLMLDYKEENPDQYWEMMNLLFNKKTGAGLSHIKIEMGSDVNSSSGTEPATMRTADEEANVKRGAGWQFAADALTINPDITVEALRWGEPAWVAEADDIYAARYKWYKETIDAAYDTYGIEMEYIEPCENEVKTPDYEWIKYFAEHLKAEKSSRYDYSKIKIVAADCYYISNSTALAQQMLSDSELMDAIDVISLHYTLYGSEALQTVNEEYQKEIWYGEGISPMIESTYRNNIDSSEGGLGGNGSILDLADRLINSYNYSDSEYPGSMTCFMMQPTVAAYYQGGQYTPKQLISAYDPWSGEYSADAGIQMSEHFMRFTNTNWEYIDSASYGDGTYSDGGVTVDSSTNNYLTLTDPDTGDYSMILCNNTSSEREYDIVLNHDMEKEDSDVYVWETRGPDDGEAIDANWFKKIDKITPELNDDGYDHFSITIKPYSIVTLTTLDEGTEYTTGSEKLTNDVQDQPLTLPYKDDFEYANYRVDENGENYLERRGGTPRYTTDQRGAFEVTKDGSNHVLTQMISEDLIPSEWDVWGSDTGAQTTVNPSTLLGDESWANYKATIDFKLDLSNSDSSYSNYAGIGVRQVISKSGDDYAAYSLKIYQDGTYDLLKNEVTVSQGNIEGFDNSIWHTMAVQAADNEITVYVDGDEIDSYTDTNVPVMSGRITLSSGYYQTEYDNLLVEPVEGYATYATKYDDWDTSVSYQGDWTHTQTGYSWYNRTYSSTENVGAIATISFTDTTTTEGTLNKIYYYRNGTTSWSSNSQNAWSSPGTDGTDATCELAFNGTGIILNGRGQSTTTSADVYIDGEFDSTITYSTSSSVSEQYRKVGLSSGEHTIKLVVKSGYVSVSSFVVLGDTETNKVSMTFEGNGTGFNLNGNTSSATIEVIVDGEEKDTADIKASSDSRSTSYWIRNLKNEEHTFEIVVTSGSFTIDDIDVLSAAYQTTDPDPEDPVTPVDPTDPSTPVDPTDPSTPVDPTDPSTPVDPTDPSTPVDPTDPSTPVDPTDPSTPEDPEDPSTPIDPDDSDSDTPIDPSGIVKIIEKVVHQVEKVVNQVTEIIKKIFHFWR